MSCVLYITVNSPRILYLCSSDAPSSLAAETRLENRIGLHGTRFHGQPLRPDCTFPERKYALARSLGNTGDQSTLKRICCNRSRSLSPSWNPVRQQWRGPERRPFDETSICHIFGFSSTLLYIFYCSTLCIEKV